MLEEWSDSLGYKLAAPTIEEFYSPLGFKLNLQKLGSKTYFVPHPPLPTNTTKKRNSDSHLQIVVHVPYSFLGSILHSGPAVQAYGCQKSLEPVNSVEQAANITASHIRESAKRKPPEPHM